MTTSLRQRVFERIFHNPKRVNLGGSVKDAELISKEQATLNAIANHMTERLYGRVSYKSQKRMKANKVPVISKQVQIFWGKCTCTFEEEVVGLFGRHDIKLNKSSKLPKKRVSEEVDSKGESLREEFMLAATSGGWKTPMAEFKRAYDDLISSYGIDDDMQLQKLDESFLRFCLKVNNCAEHNEKKRQFKGSILGPENLARLPYLLNLAEKNICRLLPYLLTAYTLKAWNSRFLFKKRRLAQLICPIVGEKADDIDSTEASKLQQRIKPFSQIFSLEGCKEKELIIRTKLRPAPYLTLFDDISPVKVKTPCVRYKEVLDQVFEIWCKVVNEYAPLAEIEGFPSDIDWDACKKLYSYYTTGSRN